MLFLEKHFVNFFKQMAVIAPQKFLPPLPPPGFYFLKMDFSLLVFLKVSCRYMVGYLRKSIEGIRISLKSRDSHTFCPLSAISGMCSVKEGYAS